MKSKYISTGLKIKTMMINLIYYHLYLLERKNKNWESFQLNEFLNYKGNNYYIKRFNANNFCAINSYFKIKGVLYENLIESNFA